MSNLIFDLSLVKSATRVIYAEVIGSFNAENIEKEFNYGGIIKYVVRIEDAVLFGFENVKEATCAFEWIKDNHNIQKIIVQSSVRFVTEIGEDGKASLPAVCVEWNSAEEKSVPGVRVIRNFVDTDFEKDIAKSIPNKCSLSYGYSLIQTKKMDKIGQPVEIPDLFVPLLNSASDICNFKFNQISCEKMIYRNWIETHSAFEETIAILCLGNFTMVFSTNSTSEELYIPSRSLVVLEKEARYLYSNRIIPRKNDLVELGILSYKSDVLLNKIQLLIPRSDPIRCFVRKIRNKACECIYPAQCDWHVANMDFESKFETATKRSSAIEIKESESWGVTDMEKKHVHAFYEDIADHFSHTRHSPWPRVEAFVSSLSKNTFMADVGCGNGKYMHFVPYCLGSDRSFKLSKICGTKGFEISCADALLLPYRSNVFDCVLCIAVLHHLSNMANRIQVLRELLRICKVDGQILVTAWAQEQNEESKRKFESQDVFVPWHLHQKFLSGTVSSTNDHESVASVLKSEEFDIDTTKSTIVLQRYCHVYKQFELEEIWSSFPNVVVEDSFFDAGNWCTRIRKKF